MLIFALVLGAGLLWNEHNKRMQALNTPPTLPETDGRNIKAPQAATVADDSTGLPVPTPAFEPVPGVMAPKPPIENSGANPSTANAPLTFMGSETVQQYFSSLTVADGDKDMTEDEAKALHNRDPRGQKEGWRP